jgi:hypothetical protein
MPSHSGGFLAPRLYCSGALGGNTSQLTAIATNVPKNVSIIRIML